MARGSASQEPIHPLFQPAALASVKDEFPEIHAFLCRVANFSEKKQDTGNWRLGEADTWTKFDTNIGKYPAQHRWWFAADGFLSARGDVLVPATSSSVKFKAAINKQMEDSDINAEPGVDLPPPSWTRHQSDPNLAPSIAPLSFSTIIARAFN